LLKISLGRILRIRRPAGSQAARGPYAASVGVDYAVFFVRFRKGTFVMAGKDVLAAGASQGLEPKRAVRVDLDG
jgi:hypothetical protein